MWTLHSYRLHSYDIRLRSFPDETGKWIDAGWETLKPGRSIWTISTREPVILEQRKL